MTRLLGRIAPDDQHILDDPGGKRVALVVEGGRAESRADRDRRGVGNPCVGRQQGDRLGAPPSHRFVKIDVAIDPRRKPGRAERLEPPVEPSARLAIILVGRIAEREDGEAQVRKLRRLRPFDKFEKVERGLRGVTLAVGADNDDQILLGLQLSRFVGRQIDNLGGQAALDRGGTKHPRNFGTIAGLATVKHGQGPRARACLPSR